MRVLITWGTKMGGTAGIAAMVAGPLHAAGHEVVIAPAATAPAPAGFDAVLIGGALYANRWHRDAQRYVARHTAALRRVPTWLFSSGPLDASAAEAEIPPPRQVRALMARIGAQGHATFGGHLDARSAVGTAAVAMAKTSSGDWRDPTAIARWAEGGERALATAQPRPAVEPPGRAPGRVVEYGVVAWAAAAAILLLASVLGSPGLGRVLHALATPLIFGALAVRYQGVRGARAPLPVAAVWTAMFVGLHAFARELSPGLLTSFLGLWLPAALAFAASAAAGVIGAMLPFPTPAARATQPPVAAH